MRRSGFEGRTVAIQPLGEVDRRDLEPLAALFGEVYGIEVEFREPVDLPPSARRAAGGPFDGDALNRRLLPLRGDSFRTIGVLAEDLTAGPYGYVFGVASLTGGVATVSTARLRHGDASRFRSRLFKIVLHEYGHTFGLGHCTGDGPCLMKFIDDLTDLDDYACGFCWVCQRGVTPDVGW